MARETAHQLGTPISSLLGWLEMLDDQGTSTKDSQKHEPEGRNENQAGEVVAKMKQDVARLERIAVRFSKIGAREELKPTDLDRIVDEAVVYMRGRVGSAITFNVEHGNCGEVPLQQELIGWLLENLIRNAAQAMAGEGEVKIRTGIEKKHVFVDVQDFGVGIPKKDHETIFRPGFTTKQRGWGLGLSLGRRIVEETHHGKLYVKESHPGGGTTIRMVLTKEIH